MEIIMGSTHKKNKLTDRQQMVLDFISDNITSKGYAPTIREIGSHLGIRSTNGVNDHLKALEKKGALKRDILKSRTLRPVLETRKTMQIPLLGKIAAGTPLLAVENIEDRVVIDRLFIGSTQEVFALRVVGDSMVEDAIFDGDYIFVKKQIFADPGEIVVAMIEGEATVKRYYPEKDRIRFQPSNAAMEPIFVKKSDFRDTQILGIVVGIYRKL
jgi:repressor LexA